MDAYSFMEKMKKSAKEIPVAKSGFVQFSYVGPDGQKSDRWIYPQPAVSKNKAVIVTDSFGEDFYILDRISSSNELKLVQPDVHEIMQMCYDKKTRKIFRKLLTDYSVRSGMLAIETHGGADVMNVEGVIFSDRIVEEPPNQLVIDNKGFTISEKEPYAREILRTKYIVEMPPIQTMKLSRYQRLERTKFNDFKGALPVEPELKLKGKGEWWGQEFDDDRLAVVRSFWYESENILSVGLRCPHVQNERANTIIPLFTRENPKR